MLAMTMPGVLLATRRPGFKDVRGLAVAECFEPSMPNLRIRAKEPLTYISLMSAPSREALHKSQEA